MKRSRIFIVNQEDHSQRYGVGKYINEIVEEGKLRADSFDVISILIGATNIISIEKNQTNNITYLKIPKPFSLKGNIQSLSYLYSKAIFILLNELYQFKSTDIFHFNSNMQHFLILNIKENTKARIIYTIHVSLWKVYYNSNYKKFISDFENPKSESFSKKSINVEMKNGELSDQVICLSNSMKNDALEIYNIPKDKVYKIPNGIREQTFNNKHISEIKEIKKELKITRDDFVYIYVGRLIPQKGILNLIEAFKSVLQEGVKNVKLLLIGDGSIQENLKKKCFDFKDKIVFTGYMPPQKVKLYYKLANALIFPSLNEQSSYVMLEAMSYKLPMIVTEIDVFNMLRNEFSCLKIGLNEDNQLDKNSFKDKINIMRNNKELRKKITRNAYTLYAEKYSPKVMFNNTYLLKK